MSSCLSLPFLQGELTEKENPFKISSLYRYALPVDTKSIRIGVKPKERQFQGLFSFLRQKTNATGGVFLAHPLRKHLYQWTGLSVTVQYRVPSKVRQAHSRRFVYRL